MNAPLIADDEPPFGGPVPTGWRVAPDCPNPSHRTTTDPATRCTLPAALGPVAPRGGRPVREDRSIKLIRGLLGRLARDLTADRRQAAPSGWRMVTGEGHAVAAGTEDLAGVDLDEVLGGRFRLAVLAVAEVNASGVHDEPERFERVCRAYQERLATNREGTP